MRRLVRALVLAGLVLSGVGGARAANAPPTRAEIDTAVDRGLEWLARTQERDGSWESGGGDARSAAVTGLAGMAFMARGHVPGQGPYGDNLLRAVDFVMGSQRPDGVLAAAGLHQTMYDHGICTVMLCEAYGMLDDQRQERARGVISRAVQRILAAQRIPKGGDMQGGWRYTADAGDSDLSVTGWQLMALRAAGNIGANVPRSALDAGIAYVKRRAQSDGSFSYVGNGGANSALTGTGVLSLVLLGEANARQVFRGGDYLLTNPLNGSHYYYCVYYVAQAAWQLGGLPNGDRYWQSIGPVVQRNVLDRARAGSWPSTAGEGAGGAAYATSMAILALTVQYRYLPIYQR